MSERYVMVGDALVPWPKVAAARRARARAVRSDLAAPSIIRDGLDGIQNPCDGKWYDSKHAYYRAVKDAGCVIVGNEAEKMMDLPPPRQDIKAEEVVDAIHKVEAGYKPNLTLDDEMASIALGESAK